MDNQKFNLILDSLLTRSEQNQLNWKTTGDQLTFLLALKDSSISIFNETGLIRFEFRNERGEKVEEHLLLYSDHDFEKAQKLYDLARRKALNSDETIDRIIEQLNPDSIAA